MSRIDLGLSLSTIDFVPATWDWIDLLGDAILVTEKEHQAKGTGKPIEQIIILSLNKDLHTLKAIYEHLRFEHLHQAFTLVRNLCESVLNLMYVCADESVRVPQFFNYGYIEEKRLIERRIEAEETQLPRNEDVIREMKEALVVAERQFTLYEKSYRTKKGKLFTRWCGIDLRTQAGKVGPRALELYDLVFKFTNPYVHTSIWSLRRQLASSSGSYDQEIVHRDIVLIVQMSLKCWMELAKVLTNGLGWDLGPAILEIAGRSEGLPQKI